MRETEWDRRIRELVTETEDLLHTHTDTHGGSEDRLRELKDSQWRGEGGRQAGTQGQTWYKLKKKDVGGQRGELLS